MMKMVFFETPLFTRLSPDYFDDEGYRLLQNLLIDNPEMGEIMTGTGRFRKIRWKNKRHGKGTRGGLRIIYYYLASDQNIWFFTVYSKGETVDLAPEEKKVLKKAIQTELTSRRQNR